MLEKQEKAKVKRAQQDESGNYDDEKNPQQELLYTNDEDWEKFDIIDKYDLETDLS